MKHQLSMKLPLSKGGGGRRNRVEATSLQMVDRHRCNSVLANRKTGKEGNGRVANLISKALQRKNGTISDEADVHRTWFDVLQHGRGTVGETVLHMCFLLNTAQHRRLCRLLIPRLAHHTTMQPQLRGGHKEVPCLDASYFGPPYHGEVCLHFAIIHGDLPLTKLLIENGADVITP